jgi:hypothetical protein
MGVVTIQLEVYLTTNKSKMSDTNRNNPVAVFSSKFTSTKLQRMVRDTFLPISEADRTNYHQWDTIRDLLFHIKEIHESIGLLNLQWSSKENTELAELMCKFMQEKGGEQRGHAIYFVTSKREEIMNLLSDPVIRSVIDLSFHARYLPLTVNVYHYISRSKDIIHEWFQPSWLDIVHGRMYAHYLTVAHRSIPVRVVDVATKVSCPRVCGYGLSLMCIFEETDWWSAFINAQENDLGDENVLVLLLLDGDILQEFLKSRTLHDVQLLTYFSEFNGPVNVKSIAEFIVDKFDRERKKSEIALGYVYITTTAYRDEIKGLSTGKWYTRGKNDPKQIFWNKTLVKYQDINRDTLSYAKVCSSFTDICILLS